jgi:hypothetical protein
MMRNVALTKLVFFGFAIVCCNSCALAGSNEATIVRLNDTSLSSQQVDDTVNRLIAAAHAADGRLYVQENDEPKQEIRSDSLGD